MKYRFYGAKNELARFLTEKIEKENKIFDFFYKHKKEILDLDIINSDKDQKYIDLKIAIERYLHKQIKENII